VWLNLLCGSTALLGTGLALSLGSMMEEATRHVGLPIAAGGFVYLAAADLLPELQHDKSLRAFFLHAGLLIAGITTMGLLSLLEST
jgi:zinc and cadmium transporter